MDYDEYEAMQDAVNIVLQSPHPTNKVAATAFGNGFCVSRTNYWPAPILNAFGTDTEIGNSSGSVHAEIGTILAVPPFQPTDGASLCVTDPLCPNCAKNIVEAGFRRVYVDHVGFEKDFYARRSNHFEDMSMEIFKKAGISLFKLFRKDRRIEPMFEVSPDRLVPEDSPVYKESIQSVNETILADVVARAYQVHKERKFAVALVLDQENASFALTARGHVVRGFTMKNPDDVRIIEHHADKYSFFQEPVNRLLMYIKRNGLILQEGFLFSSQIPTSREQVNLVGAGVRRVTIGNMQKSRDTSGLEAAGKLAEAKILNFS